MTFLTIPSPLLLLNNLDRYLSLLLNGSPNPISLLFLRNDQQRVIVQSQEWKLLVEKRTTFLTQRLIHQAHGFLKSEIRTTTKKTTQQPKQPSKQSSKQPQRNIDNATTSATSITTTTGTVTHLIQFVEKVSMIVQLLEEALLYVFPLSSDQNHTR